MRAASAPISLVTFLVLAWTPAAPAPAPAPGTIEGVVRGANAPLPRVAARYPGSGGGPARTVQRIEPVVFLRGDVGNSASEGPGDTPMMAQEDTAFVPSIRVVPVGSTIEFPNRDSFFHNVFSYSPAARFDLGRYPRGESKSVTFDQPGVVKIYCEVHDFMRAAVVVVENPFHSVPDEEGRFPTERTLTTTCRSSAGWSWWARGRTPVRGELVADRWEVPNVGEDVWDVSWSLEGRIRPAAGLFLAARWGGIRFNELGDDGPGYDPEAGTPAPGPWDDDFDRIQLAGGYRLAPNVEARAEDALNRTAGPRDPDDDLFSVQLWWAF